MSVLELTRSQQPLGIESSMGFVLDRSSHQCMFASQSSRCHRIVAMVLGPDLGVHSLQGRLSRKGRIQLFDAFSVRCPVEMKSTSE